MSAIARYFLQKGLCVGGYDRTPSELTRKLQKGADSRYEEDVEQIPSACRDKTLAWWFIQPSASMPSWLIPGEQIQE